MLERYGHGGDWAMASSLFGYAADELLDFSANINPLGPPEGLQDQLLREWHRLSRYPDPEVRELRETLARKYKIDVASILAGNGAAEIIDLIVRYLRPKTAAVVNPTFIEYAEALEKVDADIQSITASVEQGLRILPETLLNICEQVDLLFLGQPNNPTGQWIDKDDLIPVIEHAARQQTTIVLDEAFIDFFPDEQEITCIHEAEHLKHVIVVRSMTKFYAIPGLRLGYAVAHPDHIQGMKRLQVPWSVNHLAQKAGTMVLDHEEYAIRTRELVRQERVWLSGELRRLGCLPYEGVANYILVRLGGSHPDAQILQQKLGRQGILIRRCANFIGLDDRFFRIAVRNRADNERLIHALESSLSADSSEVISNERKKTLE